MTGTAFKSYWENGFPHTSVAAFIKMCGDLSHTEIALETTSFFRRYCTAEHLDSLVRTTGLMTIHVGATWSGVPCKAPRDELLKLDAASPERRMFVVDLDVQDYPFSIAKEDQRGNDRALPCVLVGVEILKRLLSDTFGFEQTVTFYSGRRGVHLYVLDERAVAMTDEARAAVATFFSIDKTTQRLHGASVLEHPNFNYLYDELVLPAFEDVIVASDGVGLLNDPKGIRVFMRLLDVNVLKSLEGELFGRPDGPSRWNHVKKQVEELVSSNPAKFGWVETRLREVVMSFVWPRADIAVSAKMGHLLKIPFGAHPSTGRIAVPIFAHSTFRPADVPTVYDYSTVPSLATTFDATIQQFELANEQMAPFPLSSSQSTSPSTMDIEDVVPPPPPGKKCVLEFERVIHTLCLESGNVVVKGQHRSPPANRPPVHFLNNEAFLAVQTRANDKMPTLDTLESALAIANQSGKRGEWKRLSRYPIFYHMSGIHDYDQAARKHSALLKRMEEAAETTIYVSLTRSESDADTLRSQITPAFISG